MSRTLAFGDDRSAGSDDCWQWIRSHSWHGWKLEIVTAEAPADMRPVADEDAELHEWDPDEPRQASDLGFDSVAYLRAEIDPRLALIARSWDLVAVGARGSGFLKKLHLGSTVDWLLREPASPVMIARMPSATRTIVVAADGSSHALRAVETLASLPLVADAVVHVVTVDDGRVDTAAAIGAATDALDATGANIEATILRGPTAGAIIEHGDQVDCDLFVLGARGKGGLRRIVLGSTTSAITGSTDRSVLVAHAVDDGQ